MVTVLIIPPRGVDTVLVAGAILLPLAVPIALRTKWLVRRRLPTLVGMLIGALVVGVLWDVWYVWELIRAHPPDPFPGVNALSASISYGDLPCWWGESALRAVFPGAMSCLISLPLWLALFGTPHPTQRREQRPPG